MSAVFWRARHSRSFNLLARISTEPSHLIIARREGTASAVPQTTRNLEVLTPEVPKLDTICIYETSSRKGERRSVTSQAPPLLLRVNRSSLDHLLLGEYADVDMNVEWAEYTRVRRDIRTSRVPRRPWRVARQNSFLSALGVSQTSQYSRFLNPTNHGGCPRFGSGTWFLGFAIRTRTSFETSTY